jgi:hypothetical protein
LNFTDADADDNTMHGVPRWDWLISNVYKQGPDGGRQVSPLNACTLGILKRHYPTGASKGYYEVTEFNLFQRKYAPYLELLRRSGYGYESYSTPNSIKIMERVRADLLTFGPLPLGDLSRSVARDRGVTVQDVIFVLEQSEGERGGVRFHGNQVSLVHRVSPTQVQKPYGFIPKLGNRKTGRG